MSNYRRLISYIYAYEGGVKGKNIGFAKIESRNGQCKISVNVKKVYVGSSDMGVYLLSGKKEILLGNIFIRNGSGEFRTVVQVGNVENSGNNMDSCYGLTVHEQDGAWQRYTTIWEDAVAHAAEVELADVTYENQKAQEKKSDHNVSENKETDNIFLPVSDEIEAELKAEMEKSRLEDQLKAANVGEEADLAEQAEKETEAEEVEAEPFHHDSQEQDREEHLRTPDVALVEQVDLSMQKSMRNTIPNIRQEYILPNTKQSVQSRDEENVEERSWATPQVINGGAKIAKSPIGNSVQLEKLEYLEREEQQLGHVWDKLRNQHTKIQAFEYDQGCEILTIKPQDIGLLPRETWVYGNNSFLLHGYYNYRYLILAKLNTNEGGNRYLLGIPGHYYSNEKYMASMFGFPDFVLSKNQPAEDGRFGYWYTDVKIEES